MFTGGCIPRISVDSYPERAVILLGLMDIRRLRIDLNDLIYRGGSEVLDPIKPLTFLLEAELEMHSMVEVVKPAESGITRNVSLPAGWNWHLGVSMFMMKATTEEEEKSESSSSRRTVVDLSNLVDDEEAEADLADAGRKKAWGSLYSAMFTKQVDHKGRPRYVYNTPQPGKKAKKGTATKAVKGRERINKEGSSAEERERLLGPEDLDMWTQANLWAAILPDCFRVCI